MDNELLQEQDTEQDGDQGAPPGGKSPVDYNVPMTTEERERLGHHLRYEFDRYYQDTIQRRGSCEQWRRDFEMYPSGLSNRWENAADVTAPLAHIYCQAHQTRLNAQIVQTDPPFVAVARTEAALAQAPAVEEVLSSRLEEADWATAADQVHSELPIVGNCFLRTTYEEDTVRAPRLQYDWDENKFMALVMGGVSPTEAMFDAIRLSPDGTPIMKLAWENQLVHCGVKFKIIPWEDGFVLPASVRDPEEARGIGERLMISGWDLERGAANGKYIQEAVDELMTRMSDPQPQDRADRLGHQGTSPQPGVGGPLEQEDARYRDYECYELCWRMDANDDGEEEWVIVTFHHLTHLVLRCQYLPYQHGKPFYKLFRYFPRTRELWGLGVCEKLAGVQDACTAILNQMIDHADLALNASGNFFYDGTSGLDPDKFQFQMAQPVRVENVDGIKPFELQPLPAEHYNLYQLFKDIADMVTATNNPSLGQETDASKTLGEVQIVTGQSNMIFEEVAARVARDWADVFDQVRWLEGQYAPGGMVKFRKSAAPGHTVQGEDGQPPQPGQQPGAPGGVTFDEIPAEVLFAEVDLIPTGLKQLSDVNSRTQQAATVQQVLLTHPLTMQNVPALVVALDEFLQAIRYPQRERIMAEVEKQIAAEQAAEQAQQLMAMAQGAAGAPPPMGGPAGPGGAPPAPAGGPPPGGPMG